MRFLRYIAILSILLVPAAYSHAQISFGIGIGAPVYAPPACSYGYYNYYPYTCAPYGFYGPQWFQGGAFIRLAPGIVTATDTDAAGRETVAVGVIVAATGTVAAGDVDGEISRVGVSHTVADSMAAAAVTFMAATEADFTVGTVADMVVDADSFLQPIE